MLIFLDIDGVLVHAGGHSTHAFLGWNFDPKCVEAFNYLIDSVHDPKIVLSSAWRMFGMEQMTKKLKLSGVRGTIVASTGNDPDGVRGKEILEALTKFPGEEYVILDDEVVDIVGYHNGHTIIECEHGWYTGGLKKEYVDEWLKWLRLDYGVIQ